jgi:hypothetical protein
MSLFIVLFLKNKNPHSDMKIPDGGFTATGTLTGG